MTSYIDRHYAIMQHKKNACLPYVNVFFVFFKYIPSTSLSKISSNRSLIDWLLIYWLMIDHHDSWLMTMINRSSDQPLRKPASKAAGCKRKTTDSDNVADDTDPGKSSQTLSASITYIKRHRPASQLQCRILLHDDTDSSIIYSFILYYIFIFFVNALMLHK